MRSRSASNSLSTDGDRKRRRFGRSVSGRNQSVLAATGLTKSKLPSRSWTEAETMLHAAPEQIDIGAELVTMQTPASSSATRRRSNSSSASGSSRDLESPTTVPLLRLDSEPLKVVV